MTRTNLTSLIAPYTLLWHAPSQANLNILSDAIYLIQFILNKKNVPAQGAETAQKEKKKLFYLALFAVGFNKIKVHNRRR